MQRETGYWGRCEAGPWPAVMERKRCFGQRNTHWRLEKGVTEDQGNVPRVLAQIHHAQEGGFPPGEGGWWQTDGGFEAQEGEKGVLSLTGSILFSCAYVSLLTSICA